MREITDPIKKRRPNDTPSVRGKHIGLKVFAKMTINAVAARKVKTPARLKAFATMDARSPP